jgi:putative MATE family efflux protein
MSDFKDKTRTDFTQGSILRGILKMGLPSMFGFLAQHIYAMADMFWVSRLPQAESAVAAITFFNNLLWMLFAFNHLIGPGSVAVISRRYGEQAFDAVERAIKETFLLKLVLGLAAGISGWFFLPEAMHLLGARGEAAALGISYGRILLLGLPVMYMTYTVYTALRGIANPNWAMALMVGSNLLNALIDPVLIFGWFGFPAMGVDGAAWASLFSYTLTLGLGLILFRTNWTNVRLHLVGRSAVSIKSMWQMVRIGFPAFVGELSFSGSRMMITPLVATFGTGVVAAYGVGTQLYAVGIMILVGLGLGLSSLIGHNLGAGKKERAKVTADHSIMLGVGIMSLLGILSFFFAETYIGLFFDSPETIRHGVELLQISALAFPFFGVIVMLSVVHEGVGLNVPVMIVLAIHGWGFQVLPALVVTQALGFDQVAVWWVFVASGVVTSSLFYMYYRRGRWLTAKV